MNVIPSYVVRVICRRADERKHAKTCKHRETRRAVKVMRGFTKREETYEDWLGRASNIAGSSLRLLVL